MKKTLLFGMVACLSTAAFAQGQFEAKMLPDLYTMKMSPAGNIIASYVTENTMESVS